MVTLEIMYIVMFWVVYIYSLCHFVMRIHRDTGFVYCDLTSWDLRSVYVICLFCLRVMFYFLSYRNCLVGIRATVCLRQEHLSRLVGHRGVTGLLRWYQSMV